MSVRLPTLDQIKGLGAGFGLVLTSEETAAFQQAFKGPLASYARLDELVPPSLAPTTPRAPGYRPSASENPMGAWYWKANICTGADGLLKGKRVAIKDNICVSGVPMMNGSALLEGYVPEIDATVVTRIWKRAAQSRESPRAKISASPVQAIPAPVALFATLIIPHIAPAAHRAAARCWLPPERSRWRSAAIRADRSEHRRAGAAFMD